MSIEEARKAAADRDVPWDDIRERRVLASIHAARFRPERRPRRIGGTTIALAMAAAVVLGLAGVASWRALTDGPVDGPDGQTPEVAELAVPTPSVPATEAAPSLEQSTTRFADGSNATLSAGARIEVRSQRDDRIEIDQLAGEVRYEVEPRHQRDFVVRHGDLEVRVLGTVFTVDIEGERTRVEVARGVVEIVEDGRRRALLEAGDALVLRSSTSLAMDVEPQVPEAAPVEAPADEELAPTRPRRPRSVAKPDPLREVDRARAAGDLDGAIARLTRALDGDELEPARRPTALFTLGRLRLARQAPVEAAEAFEACFEAAPEGPLASDALVEAARSWRRADRTDDARRAANLHLERFGQGSHAGHTAHVAEMRELAN